METFAIVPASSRFLWILLVVLVGVLGGVMVMLGMSARGAYASRFELSRDGLRLRGDLYGRSIPAESLRGGAARIVDLTSDRDLAPRRRTMGTAIPGYRSGWFRLASGERALLYLTDTRQAVYVPTRLGYALLLSPQRPQQFLERLRAVSPAN